MIHVVQVSLCMIDRRLRETKSHVTFLVDDLSGARGSQWGPVVSITESIENLLGEGREATGEAHHTYRAPPGGGPVRGERCE